MKTETLNQQKFKTIPIGFFILTEKNEKIFLKIHLKRIITF
jgi:hypothetical protein